MNTWLEVKDAVNKIYKKHFPMIGDIDFVKEICDNALPHSIVQVLAMECVINNRDELTEIVIDGYNQLQEKGYIIKNSEDEKC